MSSHISFPFSQAISCFFFFIIFDSYLRGLDTGFKSDSLSLSLSASSGFLSHPVPPFRRRRYYSGAAGLALRRTCVCESLFVFSGRAVSSTPKHCWKSTGSPRIVTSCEQRGLQGVSISVELVGFRFLVREDWKSCRSRV